MSRFGAEILPSGVTPNLYPANSFRQKTGALLLTAIILSTASGCGSGNERPPEASSVVTTYRGRDLLCRLYVIEDTIPDPSNGYDCDFPGFYANLDYIAPPDVKRVDSDVFEEHAITYEGGTLHCLVYSVTKRDVPAETCDFSRFHNPSLG